MDKSSTKLISARKVDRSLKISDSKDFFRPSIKFLVSVIQSHYKRHLYFDESEVPFPNQELAKILIELERSGIIKQINFTPYNYPDEPFQYFVSALPHGFGHSFTSLEDALKRAIGEAVERSIWQESDEFYISKQHKKKIGETNNKYIDPKSFSGFSEEQRNYPLLKYDEKTEFSWIKAKKLTSRGYKYCPLQLFSANYLKNTKEPGLRCGITTGQATGLSYNEALLKSILELIERDAFMITYLNNLKPPKFKNQKLITLDNDIKYILDKFARHNLEVNLIKLPTDFPVDVILSVIVDKTRKGPAYAIGASADFDTKNAIIRACSEALVVRHQLKSTYTLGFNENEIDRTGRLRYWAQHERLDEEINLVQGEELDIEIKKGTTIKNDLQTIRESFKNKKYEIYTLEQSIKKTKKLGYYSVMSFSPDLQPLHLEEKYSYKSGRRIKEVPQKLNHEPAKKLNEKPHPFP